MSSVEDHHTSRDSGIHSRLSEIRQKRGISAAGLARQAGISRQTIYAMEAGSYVPNTAVALRLARILETSVEDLFHLEPAEPRTPRTVKAAVIDSARAHPGTPVELCRVGGRIVAVPSVPAPAQLLPADGMLVSPGKSTVQLLRDEDRGLRLLLAGCDPAASLLARHLLRASVTLVNAAVNSSLALRLVKDKMAHVAGTHLAEPAHDLRKGGAAVFGFAIWEEGLVIGRGNPKSIRAADDLARPGVRLINREKGAGSRQLLDRSLKKAGVDAAAVAGYDDPPATGHLPAAWHVYSGLADCCIATQSAARAFGLDFIPLTSERYDLVIRKEYLDFAPVVRLLEVLTQSAFRRELESVCAYDTRQSGEAL